jgi:hypothetical protein
VVPALPPVALPAAPPVVLPPLPPVDEPPLPPTPGPEPPVAEVAPEPVAFDPPGDSMAPLHASAHEHSTATPARSKVRRACGISRGKTTLVGTVL